jgi:hypothetical protein
VSAWEELVAQALLGTRRRSSLPAALTGAGELGRAADHLARAAAADPARGLLDAAAVLVPWRRAGLALTGAPDAPAPPAPSGPDAGRPLGAAAAARLGHLLASPRNDEVTALLREWLGAAARGGWRLPAEHLPRLLTDATRDTALAAALVPALGDRGRWLAALRADWQRAVHRAVEGRGSGTGAPAEVVGSTREAAARTWATGSAAERRALLAALRLSDPSAGAELLAGTWSKEPGDEREAFLSALADGLGPWDEALLETALRDRREAVRARAAQLLLRVPGAALRERWATRLRAAVRAERHLLRWRLVVVPPEPLTTDELRELGSPRRPHGTGERTWALEQVVGAAPLEVWTASTGRTAEQLVTTAAAEEWREPLRRGWVTAAVRQRDAAWARALLATTAPLGHETPRTALEEVRQLVSVLPGDEAASTAARLLQRSVGDVAGWYVVDGVPPPWPRELVEAVVEVLLRPRRGPSWNASTLAKTTAARAPAEAAPSVARRVGDADPASPLGHVVRVLSTRHAMLEELR